MCESSVISSAPQPAEAPAVKTIFKAPVSTWVWATAFLLSLSMIGLSLYPVAIFTALIMLNRLVNDRYDFLVMTAVLVTSTGLINQGELGFDFTDPLLALSCIGMVIYRKNMLVKKVVAAVVVYAIFLLIMSTFSDESLTVQFITIRRYLCIITFILPLWLFANRSFDIMKLYNRILVYFLILSVFYIIDGFILNGWVLLPNTYNQADLKSVFWQLRMQPFTSYFPRKYPSAFFIVIVAAFPLARYYKLRWWQWALVIVAFASMRTLTVVAAFALTYVTFQGKFIKFAKYFTLAVVALITLYFADRATGGFLRIEQAVEQFASLNESENEDDLADFGTSRMAQILPKYEALVNQNCLAQGFGFLHPTKTTLARYQITNDYYSDNTRAEENVAMVEVTQFNTILHTGLIGLAVEIFFYLYMYFAIRGAAPGASQFYLSSLLTATIMGLGGFGGLNQQISLPFVALALGAALLDGRRRQNKPANPANRPALE